MDVVNWCLVLEIIISPNTVPCGRKYMQYQRPEFLPVNSYHLWVDLGLSG